MGTLLRGTLQPSLLRVCQQIYSSNSKHTHNNKNIIKILFFMFFFVLIFLNFQILYYLLGPGAVDTPSGLATGRTLAIAATAITTTTTMTTVRENSKNKKLKTIIICSKKFKMRNQYTVKRCLQVLIF